MSEKSEIIVSRPFGPTIAKVIMSKDLIDSLNKYVDKVVEDEKQYQRDKLRMYQMHRTYMEEVGASVGATVMSPVRVPRR